MTFRKTSARETPSVQSTMAFLYDAFLSDGETSLSWLYVGTRDFFLKVDDPRVCPPAPREGTEPLEGGFRYFWCAAPKKIWAPEPNP